MDDRTLKLITEIAGWNGRLSATIEGALIDLKYHHIDEALARLNAIIVEYNAYRDAEYTRITGQPIPTSGERNA